MLFIAHIVIFKQGHNHKIECILYKYIYFYIFPTSTQSLKNCINVDPSATNYHTNGLHTKSENADILVFVVQVPNHFVLYLILISLYFRFRLALKVCFFKSKSQSSTHMCIQNPPLLPWLNYISP